MCVFLYTSDLKPEYDLIGSPKKLIHRQKRQNKNSAMLILVLENRSTIRLAVLNNCLAVRILLVENRSTTLPYVLKKY